MATLKAGMKVRVVGTLGFTGAEGTIVRAGIGIWAWIVYLPAYADLSHPGSLPPRQFGFDSHELVPAVDPDENEWADSKLEALKRLVREPLPVHPSQLEEA